MSDCKTLIFWLSEKEKHKTTVGIEHLESFEAINNQRNLEDTYLIKEETKKLLSALRQVKHPYGQVFWLRAYEEMSFKEIGEIFDKSENWARVNYFRAKTKIRKVIEDENNMWYRKRFNAIICWWRLFWRQPKTYWRPYKSLQQMSKRTGSHERSDRMSPT